MKQKILTNKNLLLLASKYYDNDDADYSEFIDDLKKIRYLKKLFSIYEKDGTFNEKLVINHIVILYNIFESEFASNMLFFKIPVKHWPILKAILVYLNKMPKCLKRIDDGILSSDIRMDEKVFNILRNM